MEEKTFRYSELRPWHFADGRSFEPQAFWELMNAIEQACAAAGLDAPDETVLSGDGMRPLMEQLGIDAAALASARQCLEQGVKAYDPSAPIVKETAAEAVEVAEAEAAQDGQTAAEAAVTEEPAPETAEEAEDAVFECPYCEAPLSNLNAQFCPKCGKSLRPVTPPEPAPAVEAPNVCPQCGAVAASAEALFCPNCGSSMKAAVPIYDGTSLVDRQEAATRQAKGGQKKKGGKRVAIIVIVAVLVLLAAAALLLNGRGAFAKYLDAVVYQAADGSEIDSGDYEALTEALAARADAWYPKGMKNALRFQHKDGSIHILPIETHFAEDTERLVGLMTMQGLLEVRDGEGSVLLDNDDFTAFTAAEEKIGGKTQSLVNLTLSDGGKNKLRAFLTDGKGLLHLYFDGAEVCAYPPAVDLLYWDMALIVKDSFYKMHCAELAACLNNPLPVALASDMARDKIFESEPYPILADERQEAIDIQPQSGEYRYAGTFDMDLDEYELEGYANKADSSATASISYRCIANPETGKVGYIELTVPAFTVPFTKTSAATAGPDKLDFARQDTTLRCLVTDTPALLGEETLGTIGAGDVEIDIDGISSVRVRGYVSYAFSQELDGVTYELTVKNRSPFLLEKEDQTAADKQRYGLYVDGAEKHNMTIGAIDIKDNQRTVELESDRSMNRISIQNGQMILPIQMSAYVGDTEYVWASANLSRYALRYTFKTSAMPTKLHIYPYGKKGSAIIYDVATERFE